MSNQLDDLNQKLEAIKSKEQRLDDKLKDVVESKGRVVTARQEVEKQIEDFKNAKTEDVPTVNTNTEV